MVTLVFVFNDSSHAERQCDPVLHFAGSVKGVDVVDASGDGRLDARCACEVQGFGAWGVVGRGGGSEEL